MERDSAIEERNKLRTELANAVVACEAAESSFTSASAELAAARADAQVARSASEMATAKAKEET